MAAPVPTLLNIMGLDTLMERSLHSQLAVTFTIATLDDKVTTGSTRPEGLLKSLARRNQRSEIGHLSGGYTHNLVTETRGRQQPHP